MVVASGIIEVNGIDNVDIVADAVKLKSVDISEIEEEKIIFLIKRETIGAVKTEVHSIKSIADVRNVKISYYSLEGTDEGPST